ncbi:hypothetical protein T07_4452 [Trichinella nelsoni]|uniref:Uncharacterized protein n=1 Tax=Trichinella nelsoni TaxID=6336 RepID=A0A0V0RZU7_9BILA|nr:hypothetical protein T07_4452 [Trichinella nelsoni]
MRERMRQIKFHVDPAKLETRHPIRALVMLKISGMIQQAPVKLSNWPHLSNLLVVDQFEGRVLTIGPLFGSS